MGFRACALRVVLSECVVLSAMCLISSTLSIDSVSFSTAHAHHLQLFVFRQKWRHVNVPCQICVSSSADTSYFALQKASFAERFACAAFALPHLRIWRTMGFLFDRRLSASVSEK